jgi:hypothetical protein
MRKAWWILALIVLTVLASFASTRAGDDTRARKMMEEAFNRRYRWSENFKGFSAEFALTREGKTAKGSIQVDMTKPHGGVTVTCTNEEVKQFVSETLASTVTHTRASSFDKSFGSSSFAIAGDGAHGGTKIIITGHGFFKDFTVKDGNIVANHGGHGEMSSEVNVRKIVWLAECGKTLPHEYGFTIKSGDRERLGRNEEVWREIDGVWLPTWCRLVRTEGSAPVESLLRLENIKVELAGR